jgi:hypothetical protein
MNKFFILLIVLFQINLLNGQEIKYNIKVVAPRLQTADPQTLTQLEKNLNEFLNNQQWTDVEVEDEEKINCNLQLNISADKSATSFEASLSILATRPVYGSTYESVIFQYVDDNVLFSYEPGITFTFNANTFSDNLTSILAYYSYIILGLDKDSFQEKGGQAMYGIAQQIVNTLPTSLSQDNAQGWSVNSATKNNKSRYYLVENLLNSKLNNWRTGWYEYHLQGLDRCFSNISDARHNIVNALKLMEQSYDQYPTSLMISLAANFKTNELVELFKPAGTEEKNDVFRFLNKTYPSGRQNFIDLQR